VSVLLRLLRLSLAKDGRFQEILDILGPNGLGVVDSVHFSPTKFAANVQTVIPSLPKRVVSLGEQTLYLPQFQPSGQPKQFFLSQLSAGTQRLIGLIVSLIFDQSALMLIEHPEDSIHRGLLRKLIDVLRTYSDQSQLIISSHSSVVFNTLDPKAIRLVTMEEGETKVRALTPVELHAAEEFMEEEGSLADFIETVEEE
jgi:predicted ATPase